MVQFWKVRREIARIGSQFRAVANTFSDPIAQKKLDHLVEAGLPCHHGQIKETKRIALYLLYQPKGVSASTITTCKWLVREGYAPLIVSNSPLTSNDLALLGPQVWRVIERPNFGYDFGGYRDGINCLNKWGIEPDFLLILNDSVWLPIFEPCNLLHDLESLSVDIAGGVMRARGDIKFLESYLYLVRGHILKNRAFLDFWRTLRLTSNKYLVIRRGERGFSQAMIDAGLTLKGLYSNELFLGAARRASIDELRAVLRYSSHPDFESQARLRSLSNAHDTYNSQDLLVSAMRETLSHLQFYSAFPLGAVLWMSYPFLKKSGERVNALWRDALFSAATDNAICSPLHIDSIRDELRL